MSEWQKVESFVNFGSTWNLNGIGKVYVTGSTTVNQTVSLEDTNEARFWFAGNGVNSYLVSSASITQGGLTTQVKVKERTSFYVPKEGRWSDWVSISNFSLPGEVTFSVTMANVSQKIPVSDLFVPSPMSAYEYKTITEDLPETELDEEVGDLVDSLPFTENFFNLDNWTVGGGSETPIISEGLYINLPKLTEPEHGNGVDMGIIPLISHLPDKFSLEVITNCDSVPLNEWCQIIVYLYTLDYAFVCLIPPCPSYLAGAPYPYEKLYTPLEDKIQVWRWEYDTTNPDRTIMRAYYDDVFIGEYSGDPSDGIYYPALIAGSENYPVPQSAFGFAFGNHYDTGTDCRLHIKSITITEGITDRSLSEVTQTCTLTVTTNPDPRDTLVLKGGEQGDITFTFVDHYPNNQYEIQIGADTSETASNIATAINDYTLAEFTAESSTNTVTVTSHISGTMTIVITGTGISAGTITGTYPGFNDEEISVADSFTVTEGGKSVQENVSVSDSTDGLIDGLSESADVETIIDCLMDAMDESVNVNAQTDFDGLIEYMGEVVLE
jgi:hypothetical protein